MADSEPRIENSKTGLISFIKNNFIYFAMVVGIIGSVFYDKFVNYKHYDPSKGHNEHEIIDKFANQKPKFPFYTVIIIVLFILYFVFDLVRNSKTFVQNGGRNVHRKPIYTNRISKEEYQHQKNDVTDRELQKLFQNPNFKNISEKKGQDKKNWVWQTKEKEKKTVYRERESSDDENDRLSQITVSDD